MTVNVPWFALVVLLASVFLGVLFVRESFVGNVSAADTAAIEAAFALRSTTYDQGDPNKGTFKPATKYVRGTKIASRKKELDQIALLCKAPATQTSLSAASPSLTANLPTVASLLQGVNFNTAKTLKGNANPVPTASYDDRSSNPVAVQVGPAKKYPFSSGCDDCCD